MHNYTAIWYHLVWSTKNRGNFIEKRWKWELFNHIKSYCQTQEYHLDFINGMADHIHLLISPKPKFALSDIVRNIKVNSYYWVKEKNYCGSYFG